MCEAVEHAWAWLCSRLPGRDGQRRRGGERFYYGGGRLDGRPLSRGADRPGLWCAIREDFVGCSPVSELLEGLQMAGCQAEQQPCRS